MATYAFESITISQALNYDAARDELTVHTFNAPSDWTISQGDDGRVQLTIDGRTVQFGAGFQGEIVNWSDIGSPPSVLKVGTSAGESLTGGSGWDMLFGGGGADTLDGGAGFDALHGGAGDDVICSGGVEERFISGGDGVDLLSFARASQGVAFSMVASSPSVTWPSGFENLDGSSFADTLTGTDVGERIRGLEGRDQLNGGGGADTLIGGPDADELRGGDGDDVLEGGSALAGGAGADLFIIGRGEAPVSSGSPFGISAGQITDWGAGDRIQFGVSGGPLVTVTAADYLQAIAKAEGLFATGAARFVAVHVFGEVVLFAGGDGLPMDAIRLLGRRPADIPLAGVVGATSAPSGSLIVGTAGADSLANTPADDSISGLAGNDVVGGGAGADTIDGGAGFDVLDFRAVSGPVMVRLDITTAQDVGSSQGQDILLNFEGVFGSSFDDSLTGRAVSEQLSGSFGNDTIDGGWGFDTISGDAGNDRLFGDGSLSGGDGADTISGSGGSWTGGAGNDVLTVLPGSLDSTLLDGGAGEDVLTGGRAADTLTGGIDADSLTGGPGTDALTGGPAADSYYFQAGDSGTVRETLDVITGWEGDHLYFAGGGLTGTYMEGVATSYAQALAIANAAISGGQTNLMSIQVGADVFVFADTANNDGAADDAVLLKGVTLSAISLASFVAIPVSSPSLPAPLPRGGSGATVRWFGDVDTLQIGRLFDAEVLEATTSRIQLEADNAFAVLTGAFTYNASSVLTGGTVTSLGYDQAAFSATFSGIALAFGDLSNWVAANANATATQTLLAGSDTITGSQPNPIDQPGDLIRGMGGNDRIDGDGGRDSIFGGDGDDLIYADFQPSAFGARATFLRGEAGDDYMVGGAAFDDMHGNMGNDTLSGGGADDWVVGGKDNDLLFGDAGGDVVLGNLGDDTVVGGDGADAVRGGQGNDLVYGGAGADFMSGDRGDDTLVGGEGSDTFHVFDGSGMDWVRDFNVLEGDKVNVLPGSRYTVFQSGSDTIIDVAAADGSVGRMVLQGVQLSTLAEGWIFGA